ncbi:MAG: SDR family oxidoreductase, partial [Acidimicrobiales bacterium]
VRSLSRRGAPAPGAGGHAGAGVCYLRGDVHSGAGLVEAVDGVDVIVHAATSLRRSRAVEVEGTTNMVSAAAAVGAHLIYVSIVGVDAMSFAYYRAKDAAEKAVVAGGAAWTIQRATQFHDLIDRLLGWRLFPATRHTAFQPVDTLDVSTRLADLVEAGPSGRVDDIGGPAVVPIRELAATRRRITGAGTVIVPAPAIGAFKDFDAGRHLTPDHADGRVTWEQWLRSRGGALPGTG